MVRKLMFPILVLSGCLTMAGLSFAQTCPDVQGDTGCAPSPLEGSEVTCSGVVYLVPEMLNPGSVYFNCDGGGGMTFYDPEAVVEVGDYITATGIVGNHFDQIQLNNTTFDNNSSGHSYSPVVISTGDLSDGTPLMGAFMQVTGLMSKTSDYNYYIDDTSGPVLVYIDTTTNIVPAVLDLWLGDIVTVRGATQCYEGVGEIIPRSVDDIELDTVANESGSWGSIKSTYR